MSFFCRLLLHEILLLQLIRTPLNIICDMCYIRTRYPGPAMYCHLLLPLSYVTQDKATGGATSFTGAMKTEPKVSLASFRCPLGNMGW